MRLRTPLRVSFVVASAIAMQACSPSTDYRDLDAYMAEMDARTPGRIEPLPAIQTVEPFAYQVSNQRSPFEPPVVVRQVDRNSGPQVTPDFNRVKQFLEQFALGQLAMVGTLSQGNTMFALVQDGEGGVHRVQAGDYMGTDHGRIRIVQEAEIELIEIVPDGTGGWVERARTVTLAGEA